MGISVRSENDRVIVRARNTDIPMPYASAISIGNSIIEAAKQSMRMVKEDPRCWRDHIVVNDLGQIEANPVKRQARLVNFDWSIKLVDFDERVFLYLGDIEIIMHFVDAINVADQIKSHAKIAKAWAGDNSRQISANGILSDAETNYRLGI